MIDLEIRLYQNSDPLTEITSLLHRAYRVLAEMGFNYTATNQSEEVTRKRLTSGLGYVALLDGKIVGTISLKPPEPENRIAFYRTNWHFSQFAVEPALQRTGIGGQMMTFVEAEAKRREAVALGLDTSEGAHHLVGYYAKRGYEVKEYIQWRDKTYRSVVMGKTL